MGRSGCEGTLQGKGKGGCPGQEKTSNPRRIERRNPGLRGEAGEVGSVEKRKQAEWYREVGFSFNVEVLRELRRER